MKTHVRRFVGGLSALHMYLSGSNQTTYEHFRHRYSDAGNPYNVGVLRNCASIFCTQAPKRSELGQLASKAPEPREWDSCTLLRTSDLHGHNR